MKIDNLLKNARHLEEGISVDYWQFILSGSQRDRQTDRPTDLGIKVLCKDYQKTFHQHYHHQHWWVVGRDRAKIWIIYKTAHYVCDVEGS